MERDGDRDVARSLCNATRCPVFTSASQWCPSQWVVWPGCSFEAAILHPDLSCRWCHPPPFSLLVSISGSLRWTLCLRVTPLTGRRAWEAAGRGSRCQNVTRLGSEAAEDCICWKKNSCLQPIARQTLAVLWFWFELHFRNCCFYGGKVIGSEENRSFEWDFPAR